MEEKGTKGRPPKYNATYHPLIVQALAESGKTDEEIAERIGIAVSTLYEWSNKYQEFSEAKQRGKQGPDDQVEKALFERATGYCHADTHISNYQGKITKTEVTKHYPPDTAAAFIWLKNRRPDKWRDRQEIEHSGQVNVTFDDQDENL